MSSERRIRLERRPRAFRLSDRPECRRPAPAGRAAPETPASAPREPSPSEREAAELRRRLEEAEGVREKLERAAAALGEAAARFREVVRTELHDIEPQVVRLALAAAERVLEREVSQSGRQDLERWVSDAIGRIVEGMAEGTDVEVRLHPEDAEALREGLGAPEGFAVRVKADDQVGAGRAELRAGLRRIWVDARAELGRIADALLGEGGEAEDAAREDSDG